MAKKGRKKKPTTKKGRQKSTTYKPTIAEKRILETLLNPEHRLKSVTEVCQISKCSRDIYYKAFKKSQFVDVYNAESRSLVTKDLAPIINASIRQAKRGDASHTKILLSMAGMLEERHSFIGKDGRRQDLPQPQQERQMSEIEIAARVAFILQRASKRMNGDKEIAV